MLKQYKKTLLVTSLMILLPIPIGMLLWNLFPDRVVTHWTMSGTADGFGSVAYAVFVPPLIMLAGHWFMILCTCLDKGNRNQNKKPMTLVLWILPIVSNLCCFIMFSLSLGLDFSPTSMMIIPLGLLFAAIGNYFPKVKMNSTVGIRVPWTFSSEENWNATHRFGGKVWLIGGLVTALGGLLPGTYAIWVMILSIAVMTVVPMIYSWRYYKMQKARGDALLPFPKSNPAAARFSLIAGAVVIAFVAVVLFTGDIQIAFGEDAFTIEASYYSDLTVDYDVIEAIEYREENVSGIRVGGWGSFRLLMGYFQNEEFGTYVRYTYYNPDACVVLTLKNQTLVLSGKSTEETQAIYQALMKAQNESI